MVTNKSIAPGSGLSGKGKALILAAYEYWQAYVEELGPAAVVWLEDDSGHFVLFTRSEYKDFIVRNAAFAILHDDVMFEPFVSASE